MAFSGVLPRVVNDVGPGGPLVTSGQGVNALTKSALENQYYVPNIQSQIDQRNALTKGYNIENQYMPEKLSQANKLAQLTNENYVPNIQSEIANRKAITNKINTMLPAELQQMQLSNQQAIKMNPLLLDQQKQNNEMYIPKTQAEINQMNALSSYRQMGGVGMGVGGKEEMLFQNLVAKDNPQLKTPQQVYEASNVLRNGGNQLSDGTQLNSMSPAAQLSYERLNRGATTASLYTAQTKSEQAEKEIEVLNKYAQKGLKPYGDTYMNMSPDQIMDTFKGDKGSQEKLGRFIASQALQYEIAQNRIKLANGQPGVTSTEELMKLSGQSVKARFPSLSYTARQEASRYMDEALKEGLKARKSVGLHPEMTNKSNNKHWVFNPQSGQLEEK